MNNLPDLAHEPRLAALAWSASPAWLWSIGGGRLLFVNAAGAALLGESRVPALTGEPLERLRSAASEVGKIAGGLPTSGAGQLARLRALSHGLGRALLCLCARYRLADGTAGVLVIAQEPVKPNLSLAERVRRFVDDEEAAVFTPDGSLVHAGKNVALDGATSLKALRADALGAEALQNGDAVRGSLSLRRIGGGEHAMLVARLRKAEPEAADHTDDADAIAQALSGADEQRTDERGTPVTDPDEISVDGAHENDEALEDAAHTDAAARPRGMEMPAATLDEIAAALAGLPLRHRDDEESDDGDAGDDDAPSAPAQADLTTAEALSEELDAAEIREIEEALASPRRISAAEPPAPPVSFDDELTEDELRDLQDALAPPRAMREESDGEDLEEDATPDEAEFDDAVLVAIAERLADRHHALRFVWSTDAAGLFALEPGEFATIAGAPTASVDGTPWDEAVSALALDPEGRLARAIASRDTFSGVAVEWPVEDTEERISVVLSGLPMRGRDRAFQGYRGFGVCRDIGHVLDVIERRRTALEAGTRESAAFDEDADTSEPVAADDVAPAPLDDRLGDAVRAATPTETEPPETVQPEDKPPEAALPPPDQPAEPPVFDTSVTELRPPLRVVPPAKNVVPFRQSPAERTPGERRGLSAGERNAFQEIARQLGARFEDATGSDDPMLPVTGAGPAAEPEAGWNPDAALAAIPPDAAPVTSDPAVPADGEDTRHQPAAVAAPPEPDLRLLERLPFALMIYRGADVLFASRPLLDWTGHESASALGAAGGIEAILDRHLDGEAASTLGLRTPSGIEGVDVRLTSVPWQGDNAMMLSFARAVDTAPLAAAENALASAKAHNGELRSILDTATDGVIVLGSDGRIESANRSAEALFGYEDFSAVAFFDLFAPESQRDAADYLEGLTRSGVASLLNDGREVIGRVRQGGLIPLFMTMGRVAEGRFCAVFRDITQWKRAEEELTNAKRQAEKASSAKSDFLATISHEIRTPLNAIIGFSEVMIEERFGPLGNERYREYLKDIHTSGEHMISLINDLLDLSKIEAGRLDLTFTKVDLNDVLQQSVAIMQPQANRERIIIRTALSPSLPPVVADQRSVRQIVLNLLSNSIKFTGAGGQVIVSTAFTDQGEAVLRVRDTGAGMSEQDIATALEPFRQLPTSRRTNEGTGLGLPLTKALSEANRAEFRIKSQINSGTLVEIVFPATRVLSE